MDTSLKLPSMSSGTQLTIFEAPLRVSALLGIKALTQLLWPQVFYYYRRRSVPSWNIHGSIINLKISTATTRTYGRDIFGSNKLTEVTNVPFVPPSFFYYFDVTSSSFISSSYFIYMFSFLSNKTQVLTVPKDFRVSILYPFSK